MVRPAIMLATVATVLAQSAMAADQEDLPDFNAGRDELALFSDLPVVVSASRRAVPLDEAPVPISVVDAETIRTGAFPTIADALVFTPGIHIGWADRNHPMIGVRGFHDQFSDRTLTLIDGQIADNPIYGGSDFLQMPILMADIAHIEVVRGPGGAAWGANAFNGVINVITKSPEDSLGVYAEADTDSLGGAAGMLRWADFKGPVSWRISVGYDQTGDSAASIDADDATPDDWRQSLNTSGELLHRWTPITEVRLDLGYSHLESGTLQLIGTPTAEDTVTDVVRGGLSLDQQVSDDANLKLKIFGNWYDTLNPALLHARIFEEGLLGQVDLKLPQAHHLSVGGDLRWTHITAIDEEDSEDLTFGDQPVDEYRGGLFIIERWQPEGPWSIEGQIRGDTYSGTGEDWSGRLATLYALDADHHHVLRLATARAHRTPLVALRAAETNRILVGPPFLAVPTPMFLYRTQDLGNETTWSAELGYTGHSDDGWLIRTDAFLQRYQDLIGYRIVRTNLGPGLDQQSVETAVLGGGLAWGAEVETGYDSPAGRATLWYTWDVFETEHADQNIRAFAPAEHSVGATLRLALSHALTGTANYRFAEATEAPGLVDELEAVSRLDLVLTWSWSRRGASIALGVRDLLNEDLTAPSLFSQRTVTIAGRSFFLHGSAGF